MLQNIIVLPLSGDVSMKATVMRVSLSFLLTTILSLLFTATITSRLFTSISFVTITMLCENSHINYKSLSCNKY